MKTQSFSNYLPTTLLLLLCFSLAAPQAVFGGPPPVATTTHIRSGNRVDSGIKPGAPSNQGFTGQLTLLGKGRLQVRTAFGYTREVVVDHQTQITRAGYPALLNEAKIGDTVGVVFFQTTDRAISLAFTPKAVQVIETPEQIKKHKADAEAKTLKHYQDLADKGDAYGQYRMGVKYVKGEGVTKDPTLGRSLLEKSAAQGNDEAKAELLKLASSSGSSAQSNATQTNAAAAKE